MRESYFCAAERSGKDRNALQLLRNTDEPRQDMPRLRPGRNLDLPTGVSGVRDRDCGMLDDPDRHSGVHHRVKFTASARDQARTSELDSLSPKRSSPGLPSLCGTFLPRELRAPFKQTVTSDVLGALICLIEQPRKKFGDRRKSFSTGCRLRHLAAYPLSASIDCGLARGLACTLSGRFAHHGS